MKKVYTAMATLGLVGMGFMAYKALNKKNKEKVKDCYNDMVDDMTN